MENKEIIEFFEKLVNGNGCLEIPDELFDKMNPEYGLVLVNEFKKSQVMKLPLYEVKFFDWLKANDEPVWNDIWLEDSPVEEPYIVSLSFITNLLEKDGRGFPICDLANEDNYYFSIGHMVDEESKMLIDSVKNRFVAKDKLTIAQLLALEISMGDIDIWHFAYKHGIQINEAKKAVDELVNDNVLVHLKSSEHLATFLATK
ncbi:MAG: hypothetical protein NTW25_12985 [Candidatus Kapabacteria bacterium]|nr:hypothetical protein [Candidatus Kapabacteria bacterium]